MQTFEPSARVQELADRTRRFVRETLIPLEGDPRQTPHGPAPEFVAELRRAAADAGLLAPQVGREWGGHGLSHLETAAVLREAGYSLLGPVAMNCMAPDEGNMFLLERVATPEQQREFLAPLVCGTHRSTFLMTEPDGAGSDPELLRTTATRVAGGWRIDGLKWFITGATGASIGILMARTGANATMFLVHMDAPGIVVERTLDTLDRSMPGGHGIVRLHEVFVRDAQVLGAVNEGFRYAQVRLAPARLTHCMRWWGAARRAHDVASEYACRRQAFGKPLIEHEGVGFMLARNEVDLRQTQLLMDWAAWTLDQGRRGTAESSMAKFACGETLFAIADRAVQVLGGVGVTDETPVARIFAELRAFRIYDGPSEVHLWSLARRVQRSVLERAGA